MTDDSGVFCSLNAGAIKFTRINQRSVSAQNHFDALALFENTILSDLRKQVREAGFPEYPAPVAMGKREEIAKSFTGEAPNILNEIKTEKDRAASVAWVLVEMSISEYRLAQPMARKNLGDVWREGIHMGRLTEFWRWRSEGQVR